MREGRKEKAAESVGDGDVEETVKFISKGFARGRAPENLIRLADAAKRLKARLATDEETPPAQTAEAAETAAGGAVETRRAERGGPHAAPPAETSETARAKGYSGDPCPDCGSFTLLRAGSCLRCDTCGTTTGCS